MPPIRSVVLRRVSLNLGELHRLTDHGYFNPVFHCVLADGVEFEARMRLHITEPLDPLVIADPRAYADGGYAVNSAGSPLLRRRTSYTDQPAMPKQRPVDNQASQPELFEIPLDEIRRALLGGYEMPAQVGQAGEKARIAFTTHDPAVIGGGNTILFRYINWLAELGVPATLYSCGGTPHWTRVCARVRSFETYAEMFAAIEEPVVVLFSMWHIEPMLGARPTGKAIYHLRQGAEMFHYGVDAASMFTDKPVIRLLESLPLGVLTTSPYLHDWYRRELGIDSRLITNGFDQRAFYPASTPVLEPTVKRVATVGNPSHFLKGAKVMGAAMERLALRHPDWSLEWAAAWGENHPFRPGGPRNLKFAPYNGLNQNQMRAFYYSAAVCVNPSLHEGFGLPTLEAMASGIPVVQADNCGLRFIVQDDRDCLVVPIGDVDAMADAIERLLTDEGLATRLRQQAAVTAAQHTLVQQFDEFLAGFAEVLQTSFPEAPQAQLRSQLRGAVSASHDGIQGQPLVSVVIPSYNQADYLREALDSLLAQTYPRWEAIVVNDGSTDHTDDVLAEYARRDQRIRPYSKPNGGITSALNYGIERAQGDFFCWLSSDDLFYPEKLSAQVEAFANLDEGSVLVYGSFDILEQEKHQIQELPVPPAVMAGAEFPEAFKFDFIDGCTVMIRMSALREVGGFNPAYRHSQDLELWVRLASFGYRFHLLEQKLTIRRVHAAQSSTSNMIYCRYDAARMVDYYLKHFQLFEAYRYFDAAEAGDAERFLQHLVGRTLHTEANVNHPLVQATYWRWIDDGLTVLDPALQKRLLARCLELFQTNRAVSSKLDYYIRACQQALEGTRRRLPLSLNLSAATRNLRWANDGDEDFAKALLDYATDLLVNAATPMFAQELTFHNTNKLVDTPFKLAHSALRYLAQFPNRLPARVAPYLDLACIPTSQVEATRLFCSLRYPEYAAAFHTSLSLAPTSAAELSALEAAEAELAQLPERYVADLDRLCQQKPTEPMLYYWQALAHRALSPTTPWRRRVNGLINQPAFLALALRAQRWLPQSLSASLWQSFYHARREAVGRYVEPG
jgi:glycosyltransferase involved in cell wall biosynthesis